jgi:hypothetical protein
MLRLGVMERKDGLKLATSEHGLIQLYDLFDAAEQRCEHLRRELTEKGEQEAAANQAKRWRLRRNQAAHPRSVAGEKPAVAAREASLVLRTIWPATSNPGPGLTRSGPP